MYNNPYINTFNLNERIDNEIERLKQMKTQVATPITQNFQLAPTNNIMKYVNTIDDVKKEIVYNETPFFSKDLSVMWLKNNKGDIKCYELKEIIQKDEKDLQIELLINQVEELKGILKNEHNANVNREYDTTNTSEDNDAIKSTIKESKPTSIQRVSRSKTK